MNSREVFDSPAQEQASGATSLVPRASLPYKCLWTDGRDPGVRLMLEKHPYFAILVERAAERLDYSYLADGSEIKLLEIESTALAFAVELGFLRRDPTGGYSRGDYQLMLRSNPNASKEQRVFDAKIELASAEASIKAADTQIVGLATRTFNTDPRSGEVLVETFLQKLGLDPGKINFKPDGKKLTIRCIIEFS